MDFVNFIVIRHRKENLRKACTISISSLDTLNGYEKYYQIPDENLNKYFSDKQAEEKQDEFGEFIVRQISFAHEQMEQEMKFMEELMQTLENDNLFEILNILDSWHKKSR